MEGVLREFSSVFSDFSEKGFELLVPTLSKKLFLPQDPVKILSGKETLTGKITGLSERGFILLTTESGTREILSGEITSRI